MQIRLQIYKYMIKSKRQPKIKWDVHSPHALNPRDGWFYHE